MTVWLNLPLLRQLQGAPPPDEVPLAESSGFLQSPITRRSVLQAGAVLAAAPPALGGLDGGWGRRVAFVFDGRQASFFLDGVPAWTISPSRFSGRARLSVREDSRSIALRLRDARYPGSSVPADLRCTVTKGRLYWTIDLRLDFGGFRSSGEIEPWLAGEQALSSRVEWQGSLFASRPLRLGVALDGSAQARFSPDWTLALERPAGASVSLAGGLLPASRLEVRLPEPGQPSLAAKQLKRRSAIVAERGQHRWPRLVETGSLRGGELEVEAQAFSRFEIESHDGVEGRHVFYLATSRARSEVARIRPGADYRLPGGDPLALPLRDLRLAGFAGPHGSERALLASQAGDPLWLDAGSTRLMLGDSEDGAVLEILESSGGASRFQLAPALLATLTPIEGAIALATPPAEPMRVALQARDGDAPAGERCGACAARGDGALDVRLPGHSISVLRPEDLLVVRFELVNLEVRKSCLFERPHLAVKDRLQEAFLIVHLPPQSIAERAFLEAPAGSEDPRIACMESRLARESRLVFSLRDRTAEIPYTLPALLRWDPEVWQPAKVPATRPKSEFDPPTDRQTDIEFPWRLHLSPDDGTVWSHSLEPVTREGRTELWHTRLTLERPWEAEWPTVRAVWADEDSLPDSACPYDESPELPFRASLTDSDRSDIVQASHQADCQPRPVAARLLALSSLGAWSDLRGDWPCTDRQPCNSLEKWTHVATMGRDHKVVIERRSFACRTGHKLIYVKETTRELIPIPVTVDGRARTMFVAFLRQRFYVKVKEPKRTYGNWDMHHRSIEILDERTPYINEPNSIANGSIPRSTGGGTWEDKVFWPTVGTEVFQFRMKGVDYAGSEETWQEPLLIIQQFCDPGEHATPSCLATADHFLDAVLHYNASPRRVVQLDGQPVAIAPSLRKGDTEVTLRSASFRVRHVRDIPADPCAAGYLAPDSAALKLHEDPCEPPFWPSVESLQASVPAVEAFLGASEPATWFPLSIDCNDAFEAFAKLAAEGSATASFHDKSDRSGGSLGPSPKITHLSRRFGPVGLGTHGPEAPEPVAGNAPAAAAVPVTAVSATDFFDPSAKLFGTISLAEIIGNISPDDGTVPALLSLLTPFADGPDFLQQSLTWETQSFGDIQLGGILAFEPRKTDPRTRFAIDGSFTLWIGQPESARFSMQGRLESFAIRIGFETAGARVNFNSVTYQALSDGRTSFDLDLGQVEFLGALAFIQKLAERLREFLREELGVEVDLQETGLTVWMPPINLPALSFGMVTIKNLNIRSWVRLPFTPNPIELGFSFGRSDAPCELSVGIFGGTAYALVLLDTDSGGIRRFEVALEFGVLREVSFGPAHGRVYLLGGVFFSITTDKKKNRVVVLRAFVRAGGSVDVLGLITAYIDLYIGLRHESNGAQSFLVGEASLTIGFKIAFVKYSVTLRRTERLAGSASSGGGPDSGSLFRRSSYASLEAGAADGCMPSEDSPLRFEQAICEDDWIDYWAAFAPAEEALDAA